MCDSGNLTEEYDPCEYYGTPNILGRFALILVFGSALCVFSFIENSFLAILLIGKRKFRRSPMFYLGILAILDTVLSPIWIFVLAVPIYFDYYEDLETYNLWLDYVKLTYTASQVLLTASAYLIVFALFESFLRFLEAPPESITRKILISMRSHRNIVVLSTFFVGICVQGSVFWESAVIKQEQCTGFANRILVVIPLFLDPEHNRIWTFYIRQTFDVIVPFLLLCVTNIAILVTVKLKLWQRRRIQRKGARRHDLYVSLAKVTPKTSVAINSTHLEDAERELRSDVLEYLLSNILQVILTCWETFAPEILCHHTDFHDYASSSVSIMTVISRVIRLPIYAYCNTEIRQSLKDLDCCGVVW